MLHVTPVGWAATISVIAGLLAADWYAFGRRPHTVGLREAVVWSIAYIGIALAFGVVFGLTNGWELGGQYLAGYLVEKSLSVDNLFVFVLIIAAFAVPPPQQPKVLSTGIALALGLRAAVIAAGAALLHRFSAMFLVFGAALIVTAVQLYRHRDEDPHVEDNVIVRVARRAMPVSDRYDGSRITTRRQGRWMLTPLFLALLAIGSTDVLFAFDSIPAVFGVTAYGYIVFVANAFALLGLRPLFFLVSGLLRRLVYMSTGLAVILAFIGSKLVLEFAHGRDASIPEITTGTSLAVIGTVLVAVTIASVRRSRLAPRVRAHPGALRSARRGSNADESVDRGLGTGSQGEAAQPQRPDRCRARA
jgi:tellurite resistance protein TerC